MKMNIIDRWDDLYLKRIDAILRNPLFTLFSIGYLLYLYEVHKSVLPLTPDDVYVLRLIFWTLGGAFISQLTLIILKKLNMQKREERMRRKGTALSKLCADLIQALYMLMLSLLVVGLLGAALAVLVDIGIFSYLSYVHIKGQNWIQLFLVAAPFIVGLLFFGSRKDDDGYDIV